MDPLSQMFDLLDHWRHLPAYQLERRADILFAIYLPGFLSHHLGVEIRPEMIPEFPVRQGTIYPESPEKMRNLSCKIDYVALAIDRTKAWFVELKTDALSRRDRQDEYLLAAQKTGMPNLVDGVCKLFLQTKAKGKYHHLLALLEEVDLLKLPPSFHSRPMNNRNGPAIKIADVQISQNCPEISILYLQPRHTLHGEIGFETFADWVAQFGDPLSQKFSQSLRQWSASPAGVPMPMIRLGFPEN